MYKHIFYCMLVVIFTATISSCGKDGEDGKPGINGTNGANGKDGKDGADGKPGTVITISADGYWVIDGVKTTYKVAGSSIPSIEPDGYWYLDGVQTAYKAVGEDGAPGSVLSIGTDGYWYIDGVKTAYKAEGSGNVFKITFDSDGGSAINPENVIFEGKAKEPAKAPKKSVAASAIAYAGLYATEAGKISYTFDGWYKDGETDPFDFDTQITGNVSLKAKWTLYGVDFTGAAGIAEIDKIVNYINANPAQYALLLDGDVNVIGNTTRALSASGTKLTIIGIGSERTISLSSTGRILTVGASGATGVELTLGNNVTVTGWAANTTSVLHVQNGAALTMLAGSKITGNTSSGGSSGFYGAAVSVADASSFTMEGGTISGNSSTTASNLSVGGLYATGTSNIALKGGNITGNTGECEILILQSVASFSLSGTANIGKLMLNANNVMFPVVTIASGWSGSVAALNLRGNSNVSIAEVATWWTGKPVLTGSGLNAATVAQVGLGNFLYNVSGSTQAISATHFIDDTTGELSVIIP